MAAIAGVYTVLVSVLAPRSVAVEPPRYKFEVGQVIAYRSDDLGFITRDSPADGKKSGSTQNIREWTIWVTRKNEHASHRLFFRVRVLTIHKDAKGEEERRTDHTFYAYGDVTDDGQLIENPSLVSFFNIEQFFPRLPPDAESLRHGWAAESTSHGNKTRSSFRLLGESPPNGRAFEEVSSDDPIQLVKRQDTYRFDSQRGLVQTTSTKRSFGWPTNEEFAGTYTLTGVKQADSDWIGKLDRDIEDCFAPFAAVFEDAQSAMDRDPRSTEEALAKIVAAVKSAHVHARVPLMRQFFREQMESVEFAKYRRDQAAKFAAMFDRPAPDWELQDLAGKTHKLSDYRGKVVVLDFWSRRCAPCIPVMRTLAELSKRFDARSVAILGMNDDENEADARFVHEYVKIPYPTLRAAAVLEDYHVSSWPAIYVIDANGKLRHARFGNPDTVREDLAAQVSALLKEAGQR